MRLFVLVVMVFVGIFFMAWKSANGAEVTKIEKIDEKIILTCGSDLDCGIKAELLCEAGFIQWCLKEA